MRWPRPDEEPAVKTVIMSDNAVVKREVKRWACEREVNVGAGVWMRWTDVSQSDVSRVGAAAVGKHRDRWKAFRSDLAIGLMGVYHAEMSVIGLALRESINTRDQLETHRAKMIAVFSNSQAAFRRTEHLVPGPGQPLARRMIQCTRNLRKAGIETHIHWVPGHTGIPRDEDADHQANLAGEGRRAGTVRQQIYTSVPNRTR